MPIVITFDVEGANTTERNRIQSFFQRFGWQSLGGSSFRYPKLGSKNVVEDWFNHVVPALMLFRSYILTSGRDLTKFTIDCNTSTGFDEDGKWGAPPKKAEFIDFKVPPKQKQFGEKKLKQWLNNFEFPYQVNDVDDSETEEDE